MNYCIKQYLKLALLGLIVVGINHTSTCFSKPREGLKKLPQELNPTLSVDHTMRREAPKVSSTTFSYPEEEVFIDYYAIFNPGDMDGDWSGNYGPLYTGYDSLVRDTPDKLIDALERRFQEIKNSPNLSVNLLPFVKPYGDFSINLNGLKWNNYYGIGAIFWEKVYGGNPLATAASLGRLDVVKAIIAWLIEKLQELNAMDKLPLYLNAPAVNFGVGPTRGQLIVGGTPFIFALLNGYNSIAQYFLDKGVKPEGARILKGYLSPDGDTNKAFIVRTKDGRAVEPEELNIEKLILDAHLKLNPKLEASLKKTEADRLQREEKEKIRLEKEHQDRIRKEREDRASFEKVMAEQNASDKKYRFESLEAALRLPYADLKLAANKNLLHNAGKAVWIYPEFFETVLIKRPDLADLIESSYSMNKPNPFAQIRQKFGTPLMRLQSNVKANNIEAVKAIIEQHPELVNQEVYDAEFGQMTPVLYCGNKPELLELLKSHGANIRAQNEKLLYYAAGSGSMEVVKRLVEKEGFMVTQAAIDIAREHGFTNIATYLQLKQHEQSISHPDMSLLM
ncbi:MAG: hypothetical protein UV38_C0003G0084 [candidate division TM6 bacterium GW2011_GWE2_42_60]|nr:MAG: hypothetical protein UV38_C0003G0084 [candidate division TM6 bacterium GW2011_GWE2_42_60]HBY05436.1 hypothetical protein [Candidatus Dependentiae bacterium]